MSPTIFQSQLITIHTIWIFFALAIFITSYQLIKLAIKNRLKIQFLSDNFLKLIIVGIIGARIVAVIFNYTSYFYEFSIEAFLRLFYIWDKGLSFSGAMLAIIIYFYYISKKEEQNFFKWLDVIIPATILGLAIGHLGTFFEGTNYGIPTSLPWGVNFESPSIKYAVPIHPTQIYAFLYASIIYASLINFKQSEKFQIFQKDGAIGLIGISAYFFFKFLEEFIRGDDVLLIFDIRITQILTLIAFLISSYIFYKKFLKKNRKKKKSK